jgi:hypothetical protein
MEGRKMNINELTIGQAKELAGMFPKCAQDHPWVIGKAYLIRTVTMIQTGRLVAVTPQELVLEDAAWIADTGRFANVLKTGKFNEVEPFPDGPVIVGRGAVIDAVQITVTPREQK